MIEGSEGGASGGWAEDAGHFDRITQTGILELWKEFERSIEESKGLIPWKMGDGQSSMVLHHRVYVTTRDFISPTTLRWTKELRDSSALGE